MRGPLKIPMDFASSPLGSGRLQPALPGPAGEGSKRSHYMLYRM